MKINFRILILTFCVLIGLGGCGKKAAPTIVGSYSQPQQQDGTTIISLVVQITQTNGNYFLTMCMGLSSPLANAPYPCLTGGEDDDIVKNIPLTIDSETKYSATVNSDTRIITAAADYSSISLLNGGKTLTFTRLPDAQAKNIVPTEGKLPF